MFLVLVFNAAYAQEQYKITYSASMLSNQMNQRLAKEVADLEYLKAYKQIIQEYEVFYSLFIDTKKGTSILIEEKEYGLDGPPPFKHLFSYYQQGKVLYVEDLFRGKKFNIKDHPDNLKWEFSKEIVKIGAFQCRKASLINDPFHTHVWFSEDFPLAYGPYLGVGLPGLTVLVENDYFSIQVKEITKQPIPARILQRMQDSEKRSGISFENYFKAVTPILKTMSKESLIN